MERAKKRIEENSVSLNRDEREAESKVIEGLREERKNERIARFAEVREKERGLFTVYALTDPDPTVMLAARNALRRLSRRPQGFGLSSQPSETDRRVAIEAWKKWYLAVRPDERTHAAGMNGCEPASLFQDHGEVVGLGEIGEVVAPPSEFESLSLGRLARHPLGLLQNP